MQWIAIVANGLKLANAIAGLIKSHRDFGAGWNSAIAQALTTATAQTQAAKEEIDNAAVIHAKDSTDGAFDPDFRRD
jgi:hypothetical protein